VECPKCGTSQEDGREDCVSCGIIFERWRRAQDQAVLARGTGRFEPAHAPVAEPGLPKWLVLVVVSVIVVFGLIWTMRRREARSRRDLAAEGKATINRINNEAIKARQRLQSEQDRANRMREDMEQEVVPEGNPAQAAPRDFSLSDTTAMELINRCSEIAVTEVIKLPRQYHSGDASEMFRQYPELSAAQKSRILIATKEGPLIVNNLGVTGGVFIREMGEFFEIELGRRHIVRVKGMQGDIDHVTAQFEWEWEQKAAAEILTGSRGGTASAHFLRQNDYWTMTDGTLKASTGSFKNREREWLPLCQKRR
jgi:hypothetical protein